MKKNRGKEKGGLLFLGCRVSFACGKKKKKKRQKQWKICTKNPSGGKDVTERETGWGGSAGGTPASRYGWGGIGGGGPELGWVDCKKKKKKTTMTKRGKKKGGAQTRTATNKNCNDENKKGGMSSWVV